MPQVINKGLTPAEGEKGLTPAKCEKGLTPTKCEKGLILVAVFAGITHQGGAIAHQGQEKEEEVPHAVLFQEEEGQQREHDLSRHHSC